MLAALCLSIWLYLVLLHGRFWSSAPQLSPAAPATPPAAPDVDIVVPARDEAETIGRVIASLVAQHYGGNFRVILVDDGSTDGTAELARASAQAQAQASARAGAPVERLRILAGAPKPPGWSGKLWAVSQGVAAGEAPLILLTDADIVHDPRHLATLVARLEAPRVDLVSEMVRLNCESAAERGLVPAFVYFFQMLYPFARVNQPNSRCAAAAGGTILVRRAALQRAGGIEAIRGALIDDVALAQAVKRGGAIWLGHSGLAVSIRRYPAVADIWHMITRTAFTQLRLSAGLLVLTVLGLMLVWWAPLGVTLFASGWQRVCGASAYGLGALSFLPTLARYGRSRAWALLLPLIAVFYMAATVASAWQHWRGSGARWKNRDYGSDVQP